MPELIDSVSIVKAYFEFESMINPKGQTRNPKQISMSKIRTWWLGSDVDFQNHILLPTKSNDWRLVLGANFGFGFWYLVSV